MSELQRALLQVSEIRAQVSKAETFRGYRSATIGFSGLLACVAAGCQALWFTDPAGYVERWLTLWIGVAIVSVIVIGGEMVWSLYRSGSRWRVRTTRAAVDQLFPCLIAGVAVTIVLIQFHPQSLAMLPGLWAVLFSLGVFASCRLLPQAMWCVGTWYLVSGIAAIGFCREVAAFSPFAMAGTFGIGQLLTAVVLHCSLERVASVEGASE